MAFQDDNDLIVFLAGGTGACSLNTSPGKNWVEKSGGLPNYICHIARAVMKSGKSRSSAIAIAVSRVKKWAAGGDNVNADTRAKAAAALAEWNKLKASSHAGKVVKATNDLDQEYIFLSDSSFNTDIVRAAWEDLQRTLRQAARDEYAATHPNKNYYDEPTAIPYNYIRELWTDHIIVYADNYGGEQKIFKVEYEVNDGTVTFHDPQEVKQQYVVVDEELTEDEKALLGDLLKMSAERSMLERIVALSAK